MATSGAIWFLFTTFLIHPAGYPEVEPPGRKPVEGWAAAYQDNARRIVSAALGQSTSYERLERFCLMFPHRLSGSKALEQAIDWTIELMKADGQENVRREKVMVPHWERGEESAAIVEPRFEKLHMLGLGGSVGTPPEGITAPVEVVANEAELNLLGEAVAGKIVLFNHAMAPYDPVRGSGYGAAVRYRVHGPRLAAEKGAVACLVRSVTANSLRSPHTGATRYGDAVKKIPAAAVSIEDAEAMARMQRLGIPVVVNLKMNARTLPDAESANVVAELRGREKPEEIVVIGGHIDGWDVGHGAHDDAGGCMIAIEALRLLRELNLTPRRTIRVVLWTNEENGLAGGRAYAKDHADDLHNHVVAIESDSGVFRPTGFGLSCEDKPREAVALMQMAEILRLFDDRIGVLSIRAGGGGADIGPMRPAGVILMGHEVEGSTYFDLHHSHADTIDKVDPQEFVQNVAVLATVAYVIADMPMRLGQREASESSGGGAATGR